MKAWNLMQGIDWQALPVIAELYGVKDIEGFIVQLVSIRDYQNARRN